MKIKLTELPHHYVEFISEKNNLNATITKHKSMLKIVDILDTHNSESIDSIRFECSEIISDTLLFEFTALDFDNGSLTVDQMSTPGWLDHYSTDIRDQHLEIKFINNKNYTREHHISFNLTYNSQSYTYQLILDDGTLEGTNKFTSCHCTSTFFPNPTNDNLVININEPIKVKLYDMNGSSLPTKYVANTLKLGQMEKGIYVLKVFNQSDQLICTKKIIKR